MDYPALSKSLANIYLDLYSNQRAFDTIALPYNTTIFPYYYTNICDSNILSQLSNVQGNVAVNPSGMKSSECLTLLDGFLSEGLRLGIVAYTETLLKISKLDITAATADSRLASSIKITKFL